jgi:hypothetical protein
MNRGSSNCLGVQKFGLRQKCRILGNMLSGPTGDFGGLGADFSGSSFRASPEIFLLPARYFRTKTSCWRCALVWLCSPEGFAVALILGYSCLYRMPCRPNRSGQGWLSGSHLNDRLSIAGLRRMGPSVTSSTTCSSSLDTNAHMNSYGDVPKVLGPS